jgi:hypothetical protein
MPRSTGSLVPAPAAQPILRTSPKLSRTRGAGVLQSGCSRPRARSSSHAFVIAILRAGLACRTGGRHAFLPACRDPGRIGMRIEIAGGLGRGRWHRRDDRSRGTARRVRGCDLRQSRRHNRQESDGGKHHGRLHACDPSVEGATADACESTEVILIDIRSRIQRVSAACALITRSGTGVSRRRCRASGNDAPAVPRLRPGSWRRQRG